MRKLFSIIVVVGMTAPLAGCIIATRSRGQPSTAQRGSCPPAHHWEGGVCVHNGNGNHRGHP